MNEPKAATPADVENKLIDYRDVQDILDKAVKTQLDKNSLAQKAEVKALYDLVFETNKSVKDLSGQVTPIVIAWGDGKIVGKIMWLILKGILWFSIFTSAVVGAYEIIKQALKNH